MAEESMVTVTVVDWPGCSVKDVLLSDSHGTSSVPQVAKPGSTSANGCGEKPPVEPPILYMPQLPPPRYSALLALGSAAQLLVAGLYCAAWLVTTLLLLVTPPATSSWLPDPL